MAPRFKQERNIQEHMGRARCHLCVQKIDLCCACQRMHHFFQCGQLCTIFQNNSAQRGAVHGTVAHGFGKQLANRPNRSAANLIKPMHGGIGVIARYALFFKQCGGLGFPHADRARQTDQIHHASPRSRCRRSRNTLSKAGCRPNHKSNACAA